MDIGLALVYHEHLHQDSTIPAMSARDFSRRYSLFFACLFLGAGVQLPFLPLWLAHKGLTAPEIGIVIASSMAVRAVGSPIGTAIADRLRARRKVMVIAATVGTMFSVALAFATSFAAILAFATLMSVFMAPVFPLGESAAVEGSVHHGVDYGRMRLWGSLSFVAGSLGAGALLQVVNIGWAVPVIALGNGILALACLVIPGDGAAAETEHASRSIPWRALLTLPFFLFIAAASFGQASHAVLYGFGALNWDQLGYQKSTIAIFWAASITAEVFLFAFSRRVLAAFGGIGLMIIGAGAGLLRWPIAALNPAFGIILATQALHALTFAALHLGSMNFIQQQAPRQARNTAQGLYAAIMGGIAMSLATWASGPLYGALQASAYFAMAGLSAIAVLLAIALHRISPKVPQAPGA